MVEIAEMSRYIICNISILVTDFKIVPANPLRLPEYIIAFLYVIKTIISKIIFHNQSSTKELLADVILKGLGKIRLSFGYNTHCLYCIILFIYTTLTSLFNLSVYAMTHKLKFPSKSIDTL